MNHIRSNATHIHMGRYLYLFTVCAGIALLLSPLLLVTWLSFFKDSIPQVPPTGYSMSWYQSALSNDEFVGGFFTSLRIAVIATVIGLVVTTPAAIALHRRHIPFSAAIIQFLLSPMVIPGIVIGAGLYITLIQGEILNEGDVQPGTNNDTGYDHRAQ